MTETPLEIALQAQRPISEAPRQPLEVERLLTDSQRRITIADVERFRQWAATGEAVDPDADIEDLLSEIRHAQPFEPKPNSKLSRR